MEVQECFHVIYTHMAYKVELEVLQETRKSHSQLFSLMVPRTAAAGFPLHGSQNMRDAWH